MVMYYLNKSVLHWCRTYSYQGKNISNSNYVSIGLHAMFYKHIHMFLSIKLSIDILYCQLCFIALNNIQRDFLSYHVIVGAKYDRDWNMESDIIVHYSFPLNATPLFTSELRVTRENSFQENYYMRNSNCHRVHNFCEVIERHS